jgi:broad specificity phosphatase PhoE
MLPGAKPFYGPNNQKFPASGGLLLVRHSERPPIRNIPESYTVGITETGKKNAYDFGKQLAQTWSIGEAVASPVSRCMETCEYILCGAVNGSRPLPVVRPLNVLHFDQKLTGIPGLSQVFLDDQGFIDLVSHPQSTAYDLLRRNLLDELPIPAHTGLLNIAVTHDVIVTFLQASLMNLPTASVSDFPGFLEGILLVDDGGQIKLA